MTRKLEPYPRPLAAKFVEAKRDPGKYYDGRGSSLYLRVLSTGYKYWEARVTVNGCRRIYGIGSYPTVTLQAAREKARSVRDLARAGDDPFVRRRRQPVLTFQEAAAQTIAFRRLQWSAPDREARVWCRTFDVYVHPILGRMCISDITSQDVLSVLTRVYTKHRKSVPLVRARISAVMAWTILNGHRRDNPASSELFGSAFGSAPPVAHHRALPYGEVPAAVARVRSSDAWPGTRLLVEFLVLTLVRTNEARGALWSEINFDSATWKVPEHRMKMRKEHDVPLSSRALIVLQEARNLPELRLARERGHVPDLVFPTQNGRQFYNNALSKLLHKLDIDAVPHGFRSSFCDWCGHTEVHPDVRERCLAHVVGDQSVEAYFRTDVFVRRVELMESWAQYVMCGDDP